jgi:two-component system KDP operon response regulator KdpE
MATVLVVDDEPQVRHALRRALEGEGDRVLSASTGIEAVDLAAAETPDLVVLDLWLPDIDGVEVVRRLRSWLDVPILILSGDSDTERKVGALDSGADDFLQKPFGFPELTARLRALKRRTVRDQAARRMAFGPLVVDLPQGAAELDGTLLRLTPTEWQLLEAMVTHPGKLLTHRWLLARVWGDQHGDESRQALRTHIRSLRSKIGDDAGTPRYLRTESGAGYRWLPEPERPEPERSDDAATGPRPGPEPGQVPGTPGTHPGDEGSRAAALHDINNVLTALHLSLHVAIDGTGRLANGSDPGEAVERIASQLHRSVRLVERAGELAQDLRQVWSNGDTPADE